MVMVLAWAPCLLVAAASYAVVLRPQLDGRRGSQAKLACSKEKYAQALQAAKEKDHGRLAGQVEDLHQRVGNFVVRTEDAPELTFQIGTLAQEARLESFGLRPSPQGGPDGLRHLEHVGEKHLDLTFSAGFRRFVAFLNALERHRPVLFVETFSISRPVEKEAAPQANMGLTVLVEKTAGSTGGLK
jgi:hypothetical protein